MEKLPKIKAKAILVDIDGTIADDTKRNKLAMKDLNTLDWDIYFNEDLLLKDPVNESLKKTILKYKKQGYKIIFLTGRQENLEDVTLDWLQINEIPVDELVMRENNNHKDVFKYKSQKIKELKKNYDFKMGFEDMDGGIEALRYNKIPYEQICLRGKKC